MSENYLCIGETWAQKFENLLKIKKKTEVVFQHPRLRKFVVIEQSIHNHIFFIYIILESTKIFYLPAPYKRDI